MPEASITGINPKRLITAPTPRLIGKAGTPGLFPIEPGGWWRNALSAFTGSTGESKRKKISGWRLSRPVWRSVRHKPEPLGTLTTRRARFPSCCFPNRIPVAGGIGYETESLLSPPVRGLDPWKYDTQPSRENRKDTKS